jgi:hypothetical protein
VDFHAALSEAARSLKLGGVVIFEVPDALSYSQQKARVGTLFWVAMKEHINHFTPAALGQACAKHGLNILEVRQELMPMRSEKCYPSLILVVQKVVTAKLPAYTLNTSAIPNYIHDEVNRFDSILTSFSHFVDGYERITFWGIGLEFFNILAHCSDRFNEQIFSLVDSNPGKQGHVINSVRVIAPHEATIDGRLICCSYFSTDSITKSALGLGWKAHDIFTFK